MKKSTTFFFYLLGFYVVLQFTWWGYHLIQLTKELASSEAVVNKRIGMILGEGMVFLLILVLGLWKIKKSIQKEQELVQRQNNFLLSVTHELKTPLSSIKLYLQTLLKRNFDLEKREELLNKAILENERLEEIVEALLLSARIENRQLSIHKETVQLNLLIRELADKYNKKTGKPWVVFKGESPLFIENDVFMLKTIFINLIENALKYAGTEFPLEIEVEKEKNLLKLRFRDLGPGIPPEHQHLIFEKFTRLENEETRSKKGTGLGLYLVKEFTTLCGGTIVFKTNQPQGSCFELTFPA